MGPHGRKNFKRLLLWNYITDSLKKKIMHTSREGLYRSCLKIGEISHCGFLPFFFSFSLTWTIWEKKNQTISCLKVHHRFAPKNSILASRARCDYHRKVVSVGATRLWLGRMKNSCILLGQVSTKVAQRFVEFKICIFAQYFSLSLTWAHMGVKVSNDISSERAHQIYSPKFMDTTITNC